MREHTDLHPNEIDGLLNEINDFIYLRSEEISTNTKIHFKDILKAIDECGSPSEICEQYTDINEADKGKRFIPRGIGTKEEISRNKVVIERKSIKKNYGTHWVKKPFRVIFSLLKSFTLFKISRFVAISFYIFWITYFLFSFGPYYLETWHDGYINFNEARNLILGANLFAIICFFSFVIIEGVFFDFWKSHKLRTDRYQREGDDGLILFISRFGSLLLFLKCSILFNFYYLFFIPLWIILLLFMERKLKSQFWNKKISPIIISIGLRIEGRSNHNDKPNTGFLFKGVSEIRLSDTENQVILISLIFFIASFIWPWIRLRTTILNLNQYICFYHFSLFSFT
jgi:hypothetical protein